MEIILLVISAKGIKVDIIGFCIDKPYSFGGNTLPYIIYLGSIFFVVRYGVLTGYRDKAVKVTDITFEFLAHVPLLVNKMDIVALMTPIPGIDHLDRLLYAYLVVRLYGMVYRRPPAAGFRYDKIFHILFGIRIYPQSEDRMYKSGNAEQLFIAEPVCMYGFIECYRGNFQFH